jgi:hypothetical protein|tara:strand:+ start:312 stop:770 length:459 start_codon:yes stop_codon:yes gene_type:complete
MKISIRVLIVLLCISFTQPANAFSFGGLKNLFKSIDNLFDYYFGSKVVHAPKVFKEDNETSDTFGFFEEYGLVWYNKDKTCKELTSNKYLKDEIYCVSLRKQCSDILTFEIGKFKLEEEKFHQCVNDVRKELGYKIILDINKIMKEFNSDKD